MTLDVYLDESGSIHKNSNTQFFAVGGFMVIDSDRRKIINQYKRTDKLIKDKRKLSLLYELKATGMESYEKLLHLQEAQRIPSFLGYCKVFDKTLMQKRIITSNIFFNYAVKLLFQDGLMPLLSDVRETIAVRLHVDNRNIRVGELNNLENYLNTEFCLMNYHFKVKYYDSATNFGIQLADLIVNTFYNYAKNKEMIEEVYRHLNFRKFRISFFPGSKIRGRVSKIKIDKLKNNC